MGQHHLADIDRAPEGLAPLPAYLATLPADTLRRSWVALVADATRDLLEGPDHAHLVRALLAVRDHRPPGAVATGAGLRMAERARAVLAELPEGRIEVRRLLGTTSNRSAFTREVELGAHPGLAIERVDAGVAGGRIAWIVRTGPPQETTPARAPGPARASPEEGPPMGSGADAWAS